MINVSTWEKYVLVDRESLKIKNNQLEAILLQNITNHSELTFPNLKVKKKKKFYLS